MGQGRGDSSLSRDAQTYLFAQHFWEKPEAFPGQTRDIVPPTCRWLSPGPPPGGSCHEHLQREAFWGHQEQIPP
ncbi:hypothetical protein ILYODFUR_013842 [Ilyodon furcidens]|uniref:Uncharacterized protein n=1 Tax=Ilyodon furcidens TaxID=33524 RepID=A0ABV0TVI1_9TELE